MLGGLFVIAFIVLVLPYLAVGVVALRRADLPPHWSDLRRGLAAFAWPAVVLRRRGEGRAGDPVPSAVRVGAGEVGRR